jgi:hypothetical protein
VRRHGDDETSFKLHYPPVEKGAKRVKHYNPDDMPTIRKKMFWITEAKSPRYVPFPFDLSFILRPERFARTADTHCGSMSTVFPPNVANPLT